MRIPTRSNVIITACTALTLIGVFSAGPAGAQNTAKVTGTISYRDRSALPDNAEITVQLIDSSRQDVAATVIAEQKFTSGGKQVPLPFELTYDAANIDDRFTYAVQATITIDGKLAYRNTQSYPVITQGRPTNVDLVLSRVDGAAPQPTTVPAPTVTIGGGLKISGTVNVLERIALLDNAEINVQLVDVSKPSAPVVITEQTFTSNGNQSPFPFDLIYNPAVIDSKLNYAVQATITIDGKVTYRNSDVYLVITPTKPAANLDNVTVTVRRSQGDGTQPTASAPITLPVEPTTSTNPRALPATGDTNSLPIKLLFAALALLAGSAGIRFWLKQRV